MLVFPRLVQQGRIPNVDFLHLYGPGSLDVLALWYWIFGYTLESQRTFGLLQHLGIIFAVYALTRAWGRVSAVGAACIAALLIMTPDRAVGTRLARCGRARALGDRVRRACHPHRAADGTGSTAGVLAGLALTFRPDVVIAIGLALAFAVVVAAPHGMEAAADRRRRRAHPDVGAPRDRRTDERRSRGSSSIRCSTCAPGGSCPARPSWDIVDGALQAVAEGSPAVVAAAGTEGVPTAVPVVLRRGDHRHRRAARRLAAASTRQRRPAHVRAARRRPVRPRHPPPGAPASRLDPPRVGGRRVVAVARGARHRAHDRPLAELARASLRSSAPVRSPLLMVVVAPFYTYRHYVLQTRVSAGDLPLPFLVERDGRRFWFGDFAVASALNQLIVDLDELSEPGDSLIVGPADLSRTIYSDVAVYFLFPELEPGTFYIEMDPGLADAAGSGLAEDIAGGRLPRADQHLDRMERTERVVGVPVAGGEPGGRRQLLPRGAVRGQPRAAVRAVRGRRRRQPGRHHRHVPRRRVRPTRTASTVRSTVESAPDRPGCVAQHAEQRPAAPPAPTRPNCPAADPFTTAVATSSASQANGASSTPALIFVRTYPGRTTSTLAPLPCSEWPSPVANASWAALVEP